MANKSKQTTTTTTSTSRTGFRRFLGLIAFVGIILVALALIIGKIGGSSLASAMNTIASVIAYLICAVMAFYFVRSRRNVWYYVAYIVAVILIIVFLIIK